jgi:hypothetical protein
LGRFGGIVALLIAVTAVAVGSAEARIVTVLVLEGEQPPAVRAGGAVGLYVAGRGLYVSREEALADLGVEARPEPLPCGPLQRCPIEIFVSVPPLGAQRNTRRFEITIRGGGYRGLLVSDSTRIPGLIAIDDVAETVRALEEGRDPPISSREQPNPRAELVELDERLSDARRAQPPATVALAVVLIGLVAVSLLARSAAVARAALLFPLFAILFAIAVAALELTGPVATTSAVLLALPVALVTARLRGDAFGLVVAGAIAVLGIVLATSPETNALAAIGPHPWNGGRFYGITNQVETLLLGAALAAGAALADLRVLSLAALCVVVVGASSIGADGGGIVVLAVAFAVLWVRLGHRHPAWLALAVGLGAGAVALDAFVGGSGHVIDSVRGGPGELWEAFERRIRLSWSIATSSVFQAAVFVAGIGLLAWFGTQRPRAVAVDAFLAGIAVSLLANDSPTKVAGFGAVMCGALRAWSVESRR